MPQVPKTLLTNALLEQSGIVANCRMNRLRTLDGTNGYSKELGFNPLELMRQKLEASSTARWLDLCCGSGNALIEAGQILQSAKPDKVIEIVGVDLAGMFSYPKADIKGLQLIAASLSDWGTDRAFDVISCVHGLHYIGDKLGLLTRAASWLTKDGWFAANLSLANIKWDNSRIDNKAITAELRRNGLDYDSRKKRITCTGHKVIQLPVRYLGADDQSGPNYTGQAAVDSYYTWLN